MLAIVVNWRRATDLRTLPWGAMMTTQKKFLLAVFMLLNVFILGCAHSGVARKVKSIDCRSCHSPYDKEGEARDFNSIYNNPASHHPVGVMYPIGSNAYPGFNPPNGQSANGQDSNIVFFDRNDNGQPDSNEVQLFGTDIRVTVECASCHREHGTPADESKQNDPYLRVANVNSALCKTCHRQ